MTERLRGDQATVSVLVRVEPSRAFAVFTEEIDGWWRRGLKYRVGGGRRGFCIWSPASAAGSSNPSTAPPEPRSSRPAG
jgi:hypothetical protein